MGSWDVGIFDNDTASEYISEFVKRLADDVEHDFESFDNGILERVAPACIAILNAVAAIAAVDVLLVISVDRAREWRVKLRDWFNRVKCSEVRDSEHWEILGSLVEKECIELIERLKSANS